MNIRKPASTVALAICLLAGLAPALPAQATGHATAPHAATRTYDFHAIPVRSALQLIAEEGNVNLVVSDSVQGTITLHLVDVTWEEALDVVLRLKGLQRHVDGDARSVTVTGG